MTTRPEFSLPKTLVMHVSNLRVMLASMVIEQIQPPSTNLTLMTAVFWYIGTNMGDGSFQALLHSSFSFQC